MSVCLSVFVNCFFFLFSFFIFLFGFLFGFYFVLDGGAKNFIEGLNCFVGSVSLFAVCDSSARRSGCTFLECPAVSRS